MSETITYQMFDQLYKQHIDKFEIVGFKDLDELIMALLYVRQQVERRYEKARRDIFVEFVEM